MSAIGSKRSNCVTPKRRRKSEQASRPANGAAAAPRLSARNPRRFTRRRSDAIVGPFFGQIQLAIKQRVAMLTGVGQKDADLAVLNPTSRAAVLAGHAGRMDAFLEKASLVDHTNSVVCR